MIAKRMMSPELISIVHDISTGKQYDFPNCFMILGSDDQGNSQVTKVYYKARSESEKTGDWLLKMLIEPKDLAEQDLTDSQKEVLEYQFSSFMFKQTSDEVAKELIKCNLRCYKGKIYAGTSYKCPLKESEGKKVEKLTLLFESRKKNKF